MILSGGTTVTPGGGYDPAGVKDKEAFFDRAIPALGRQDGGQPRSASTAGTAFPASESESRTGRAGERRQPDSAWILPHTRTAGQPLELKAGGVIPAALVTGINSELPGQISAQVTQNVYDTAWGGMAYTMDSLSGNSGGNGYGNQPPTLQQEMGSALAAQMGQASLQLLQKKLNIAPTLEVRPGYAFNMVVTKDVVFERPYNRLMQKSRTDFCISLLGSSSKASKNCGCRRLFPHKHAPSIVSDNHRF